LGQLKVAGFWRLKPQLEERNPPSRVHLSQSLSPRRRTLLL
jgi:hypothetical protein